MFVDFNDSDAPTIYESEFCVIGAGAAGITLALALARKKRTVLLVESGGLQFEQPTQDLYRAEIAGRTHHGIHTGRFRQFGGTTTRWGGQALPLREIDFECRSWVPNSGWPIRFSEITAYFESAYRVLGLEQAQEDEKIWDTFRSPPPQLGDEIETFLTRWSPRPNFAAAYRNELLRSAEIRVLLHTNVLEVLPERKSSKIADLKIATLSGRRGKVVAEKYILCCGAIENARLLLNSRSGSSKGIGNKSDWVGRCFQDHVTGPIAEVVTDKRSFFSDWACLYFYGGLKYMPKIQMGLAAQRRYQMLNIAGNFFFEDALTDSSLSLKRILRECRYGRIAELKPADYLSAIRDTFASRNQIYDYVFRRRSHAPATGRILLDVHSEQPPSRDNRIELSNERDELGQQRSRLIWQIGEAEKATIRQFVQLLSSRLSESGLGTLEPIFNPKSPDQHLDNLLTDNNHHIGTTRMASTASEGVVDTDCRLFEHPNFYVCGSSVFPTSGHSNPTFTLIVLAIRLAEHLASTGKVICLGE